MFETRPINQSIDYIYFASSGEIPTGEKPKNGDSVTLKYKQFEIAVENISIYQKKLFLELLTQLKKSKMKKEKMKSIKLILHSISE